MTLEHLPKIDEEQITKQLNILTEQVTKGAIKNWLNDELQNLHDKNPILFQYIVERANKFAVGAVMVGDPNSVSVSMALEYMLLLNIINAGIDSTVVLSKFTDMMGNLLKGGDLEGLEGLGDTDKNES